MKVVEMVVKVKQTLYVYTVTPLIIDNFYIEII